MNPNMAWRIKVTFAGDLLPKSYITPDIRSNDPGWGSELFKRTIERLEFYVPTGHVLILAGMEQYNFFVEAVQSFGKRGKDGAQIKAFWLCGKLPGRNIVYRHKITNGKIIKSKAVWGQEWNGRPTRGWKPGLPGKVISVIA